MADGLNGCVVAAVVEDECEVDTVFGGQSCQSGDQLTHHETPVVAEPTSPRAEERKRDEREMPLAVSLEIAGRRAHSPRDPGDKLVDVQPVKLPAVATTWTCVCSTSPKDACHRSPKATPCSLAP